jgi:hypothetical protein
MNEMIMPQHVIQRLERRWAAKLKQLGKTRRHAQSLSFSHPTRIAGRDDPLQSPHVRRWLKSSLRSPDSR